MAQIEKVSWHFKKKSYIIFQIICEITYVCGWSLDTSFLVGLLILNLDGLVYNHLYIENILLSYLQS